MELQEALEKANQILDEERVSPTVNYDCVPQSERTAQLVVSILAITNLQAQRGERPRRIIGNATTYKFKSTNYDLLCALLSRLPENDRAAFRSGVALRLVSAPGCVRKPYVLFPGWLRQLEEMIALNYTVFMDSDYETLAPAMLNISARAAEAEKECRKSNIVSTEWPGIGSVSATALCIEVEAASKAIAEQSRKARYLYLKGSLSEGLNLEVNQDKIAVEQYIQQYGFPHTLVQALNEAERLYRDGTTPFDFKGSMANLRSFLENVHAEAMPALHAKFGGQLPQKWGEGLAYLLQINVLSKTEEQYVSRLYALISDEGVHPLIADKEDARLSYNTVVEYALRFFRKIEKLGIKIALAAQP
jgi:hypothetical protein